MSRFEPMREGLAVSAMLHTAIILVILLGLPDFLRKPPPPEETPIAVKLVNISELTRATQRNPKPVETAEVDTPPPPVPTVKPDPPKPDPLVPPPPSPPPSSQSAPPSPPPPPEPPKPSPPPPPPPPPPPVPDPIPAPKPPEPKPEPPKPEPPKPQPEPPKPTPKPTPPKPDKTKQDQQFDDLLKNLSAKATAQEKQDTPPKPQKQVAAAPASAQPNAPLGSQITNAEKDAIASQVEPCWNLDPGAKNVRDLIVTVSVEMAEDGTPRSTKVDDQSRYASDPIFRAAADAALRALRNPRCVPLKMPPGKYDQWKSMRINFDPKDL